MTELSSIRLGLGAVRAACDALGRPQLEVPAVLVAGTNGKGSTVAMLEAIGRRAGLRTGVFQSPSLGEDREQIRLDGAVLQADPYARLIREVTRAAFDIGESLTSFEATTVAAFLAFAREPVDLAIVEVGLGGARDATNIAEPIISVLTTVDFDHQLYLGTTLASIAREKAGIFRPRRPAILGFLRGPALRAARQEAEKIGARVIHARSRVRSLKRQDDGTLHLETDAAPYRFKLALAGEHQERNAALAALTAEALRPRFPQLDPVAIERGLADVACPGRLEWIRRDPGHFLLDGAHNPAAAAALAESLRRQNERPDLLFGAFADKDSRAMLDVLRPVVGRLLLTPIEHARSWRPEDLARDYGGEAIPSPAAGLSLIRPPVPLLVTGSMQLVGDVRRLLIESANSHAAGG